MFSKSPTCIPKNHVFQTTHIFLRFWRERLFLKLCFLKNILFFGKRLGFLEYMLAFWKMSGCFGKHVCCLENVVFWNTCWTFRKHVGVLENVLFFGKRVCCLENVLVFCETCLLFAERLCFLENVLVFWNTSSFYSPSKISRNSLFFILSEQKKGFTHDADLKIT